jgi:hypothetical protein
MAEHGSREGKRRTSSVGAYLAGTGASGSLIASALIAFGSVTAFVAFDELPGGPTADGEITIPASGELTVGNESGAEPTDDGPILLAVAGAGGAGGTGPGATGAVGGETGSGTGDPGDGTDGDTGVPTPVDPIDPTVPVDPIDPVVPPEENPGPFPTDDNDGTPGQSVGEVVDDVVQDATGNDTDLGETLSPVTDVVDDLVEDLTGDNLMSNVEGLLNPDK